MKILLTLIAVMALAGCTPAKRSLHVFIWSEYLDPALVAEFERRHDCVVKLDYYEDPESMVAKLAAGGTSTYDIVVPGDTTLPAMIQRGLLAPLRHENIPNLRNIDGEFADPPFDPGLRYSAPIAWGTGGIYLRQGKDRPVEPSWGLLFDPKLQPGPFLLMEDHRVCIGAALRYLGFSINTTNTSELAKAQTLLIETKKRSLGFEGGTGCKNRVLARGAALTMAYNGDSVRGMQEDAETAYFVPREGSTIYADALAIPAQAPHRELAEKFIDFLLEPAIAARFAQFAQLGSPNRAAVELLPAADQANAAVYPSPEVRARLEYARDLGDRNRLYDELWVRIKSE